MDEKLYFKMMQLVRKAVNNMIIQDVHEVICMNLSLVQFKSPWDFANKLDLYLLSISKELFNPEDHVFVSLNVEFTNDVKHINIVYNYGEESNLDFFKEIYNNLSVTGFKEFTFKVTLL